MDEWTSVWTAVSDAISVEGIASVLVVVAPAALVLVLAWWGIRKVTRVIMGAFRKGRISM